MGFKPFCPLHVSRISGTGTTVSYEITFDDYIGVVEPLVPDTTELVAQSGEVISSEVITDQEGTEPLRGDFTLSFRGHRTPALSYNTTAEEVRATGCQGCIPDSKFACVIYQYTV